MRGEFTVGPNGLLLPNSVVSEGEETFLKMCVQADNTVVASGGNYYIGLCQDLAVTNETVLADLTEPVGNGYVRQTVARSAAGWPSVQKVTGAWKANTSTVTFAAAGGDFTIPFSRFFIASTADNTGKLLAISDPLTAAIQLTDGQTYPVSYALYLR